MDNTEDSSSETENEEDRDWLFSDEQLLHGVMLDEDIDWVNEESVSS